MNESVVSGITPEIVNDVYAATLEQIRAKVDTPEDNIAECGTCGFRWDDTISTSITPTPSGRCPNEYAHEEEQDTVDPYPYWVADGSTQEAWNNASLGDRAHALENGDHEYGLALGYVWGYQDAGGAERDSGQALRFAAFRRIEALRWALHMPGDMRPVADVFAEWRHGGTVFSYHERGQAALTWFWVDRDGVRLRFGTEDSAKLARDRSNVHP